MNLLASCVVLGIWLAVAVGEEVPVVPTEGGKISGIVEETTEEKPFSSYYGIPYAKPPVGELRFKDPIASSPWKGVRDGSSMPPPCLQVTFGAMFSGIKLPPEHLEGEEDCLFLNVFTPKIAHTKGNLPVMVFIHGGGFFAGSADEYRPHVLLNKDIIYVVIQYRLGLLGFLSTEDSVIPGNYGLKDQTLALKWVQNNIKQFGGDPQRVTIFGESAGAASVHYQMLTPKAKGLFSGAIMMSGNALCPWAMSTEHRRAAEEVGSTLGCPIEGGSQQYLKCMQSVDARKVVALSQDLMKWFAFPMLSVPRVDGDYLPDHPATLVREGRYTKINLMTGVTAHEGAIFSLPMYAREDLIPELINNFSVNGPISLQLITPGEGPLKVARQIYNHFLGGVNLGPEYAEQVTEMLSHHHFFLNHDLLTEIHAREKGVNTFRYELTHRGEMSAGDLLKIKLGHHWVSHADDLYYFFRGGPLLQPHQDPTKRPRDLLTMDDCKVRKLYLALWANFAATGHPTPDNSLGILWEPTSSDNLRHLRISPIPAMEDDSRKEVRKFLSSLPTSVNLLLHPHLTKKDVGKSPTSSTRPKTDEL